MLGIRAMRRTALTVASAGTLAIGAGSIIAGRSQADDMEQYQLRLKVPLCCGVHVFVRLCTAAAQG